MCSYFYELIPDGWQLTGLVEVVAQSVEEAEGKLKEKFPDQSYRLINDQETFCLFCGNSEKWVALPAGPVARRENCLSVIE